MVPAYHLPPLVVSTPFSFSSLAISLNPILLRIRGWLVPCHTSDIYIYFTISPVGSKKNLFLLSYILFIIQQTDYKILLFLKYISNFPGKRIGDNGSLYHLPGW